eukprot:m.33543 g.33543  ORF g.33543 m.33543 type:complete len:219 (+) comp8564_c0_seq3:38-694(+)
MKFIDMCEYQYTYEPARKAKASSGQIIPLDKQKPINVLLLDNHKLKFTSKPCSEKKALLKKGKRMVYEYETLMCFLSWWRHAPMQFNYYDLRKDRNAEEDLSKIIKERLSSYKDKLPEPAKPNTFEYQVIKDLSFKSDIVYEFETKLEEYLEGDNRKQKLYKDLVKFVQSDKFRHLKVSQTLKTGSFGKGTWIPGSDIDFVFACNKFAINGKSQKSLK